MTNFLRRMLIPGIFILVALGLSWIVGSTLLGPNGPESIEVKETVPPGITTVTITTAPVVFRPIQHSVVAVGTLFGHEEVSISAKVEGRIRKIHHDVSARLEPGEVIMEIDSTDAELAVLQSEKSLLTELTRLGLKKPPTNFDITSIPAVKQAKARLERDEAKYARAKSLAARRALSEASLEDATADLHIAEAEYANQLILAEVILASIKLKQADLTIAQKRLEDISICVPTPTNPILDTHCYLTYVIAQRSVSEGSYVKVGDEVCKVVIDRPLKLRVLVPEHYSGEVQLEQRVEVVSSASAHPVVGAVTCIKPTIDPSNRTFEVEISVLNTEGKLKPGGFAQATILTRLDANAATVPLEALIKDAGITKVFLTESGRVKDVRVSLGVQDADFVEVTHPSLPIGSQVVVSGQSALAEDTPVIIRSD